MTGNMMGGGMSGGCFGFGFFTILIILAVIAIAVWMFKGSDNRAFRNNSLETLKERLAKGEISEEEYDRLKRKLKE
ncbi:SHOCT domain-containing protein [Lentibacillus salinarum]|uniref:SHOCT domain-containing protein n=1 Tax=Lentibacillus salinarum TaxID=446820 RepID=A0ABW3ZXX6_9BACI